MSDAPSLILPSSEQIASEGTIAITGASYSDGFAAGNPGAMSLAISDTSGDLYGFSSAGALPDNGTGTILFQGSYADVTDIINSLTYAATAATGTDDIHFDIWNQAGVETTGDIPVSIGTADSIDSWNGSVSSDWNTGANWSTGAPPVSGDSVVVSAGTPFDASLSDATLTGETITVSGSATVSFSNVTLDSTLQTADTGNIILGGTLTVGAQGTLGPEQHGSLFVRSLGSAVPIVNDGVIEAPAGSLLTFNNGGTVTSASVTISNNGLISANGGDVSFDFAPPPFGTAPPETLNNSGSISIANGGGLTLNGTFVGNDVAFAGPGALALQSPDAFAGGAAVTGFGQGDEIDLYSTAQGAPLGYGNGTLTAGTSTSIPLPGTFGVGNFVYEFTGGGQSPERIAYAPSGGPSGLDHPDITAPGTATIAQGSTLSLSDVSISGSGTADDTMSIKAGTGTLFMNGASGSGTSLLSLGPLPESQLNADLASLTYVPAAGATSDILQVEVSPPAPVSTYREIPIAITPGEQDPVLSEPANEAVAPGAMVAVSGGYSDSFAQHNPGQLFIGVGDTAGTLTATVASGAAAAGSGTNSIALSTDYVDLNAILASLHYTAGASAGSDTIQFQVWNQAGVETTAATNVTIGSAVSGTALGPADFAAQSATSVGATTLPATPGLMGMSGDAASPPPPMAALFSH